MSQPSPGLIEPSVVAVMATQDTKAAESAFVAETIRGLGLDVRVVDSTPAVWMSPHELDRPRDEVISIAGDRIAAHVVSVQQSNGIAGIVVIGGATGAALGAPTLRGLPLGFPKVLVSPVVSGKTTEYVGTADVVLVNPVVDFVGREPYADHALSRAAIACAAMVRTERGYPVASTIAITAFGVTSHLVSLLGEALSAMGVCATTFSANGTGGRAYEKFIADRRAFGAFDVTTSELVDELCGGVLSAGSKRLTTAADQGVPQVVLPGGIDFINFGPAEEVPEGLRARPMIRHTPSVTLIRTSAEENAALGEVFASRLGPGGADVTVIVPLQGFSILSAPDAPFHDPGADHAFFESVVEGLGKGRVQAIDAPMCSRAVCDAILVASEPWHRPVAAGDDRV